LLLLCDEGDFFLPPRRLDRNDVLPLLLVLSVSLSVLLAYRPLDRLLSYERMLDRLLWLLLLLLLFSLRVEAVRRSWFKLKRTVLRGPLACLPPLLTVRMAPLRVRLITLPRSARRMLRP
jgi:hypothetical protein